MKWSILFFVMCALTPGLFAKDPGMQSIGTMSVQLIFATNDDPELVGDLAKKVSEEDVKKLHAITKLDFKEYRLIGTDTPDILKGYENWATPLRPSKEILVSFQPIKRNGQNQMQIVLQYWQERQKMFSVNPTLTKGKTLYVLGPEWRKGRLILAVKIEQLK